MVYLHRGHLLITSVLLFHQCAIISSFFFLKKKRKLCWLGAAAILSEFALVLSYGALVNPSLGWHEREGSRQDNPHLKRALCDVNLGVGSHLKLDPIYSIGVCGKLESESKATHPLMTLGGHLPALFLGTQSLAFLLEQVSGGEITGSKGVALNFREVALG